MKLKQKMFDRELSRIIGCGDTTQEYRAFFKRIVELHRYHFTEENIPTAKGYLQELLDQAFETAATKEVLDYEIQRAERELNDLRKRKLAVR